MYIYILFLKAVMGVGPEGRKVACLLLNIRYWTQDSSRFFKEAPPA